MSTNNHKPIVNNDSRKNAASIWNDPMGQLDAAIGDPALANAVAGASAMAKIRTVNNRVDVIGGELADGEVLAARTAIQYLSTIAPSSLSNIVRWLGRNNYFPEAYGAMGDGSSHPLSGDYANLAAAQAIYGTTILPSRTATTISFTAGTKRIADSGNLLVPFRNLCKITVSGSTSNDGTYTLTRDHDASGAFLTTVEALTDEAAGANVTISIDWSNTETDWCAIQSCINEAAANGGWVDLRANAIYLTNHPLVAEWNSTRVENPIVSGIRGQGVPQTRIRGTIASPGRAVIEFIGDTNSFSASGLVEGIYIEMLAGSSAAAYCLRVGNAKNAFTARRLRLYGANGIAMRIGATSYAQMNTRFEHVDVATNYLTRWFADDDNATVFAVGLEGTGTTWDNVFFQNCMLRGLVQTRAKIIVFDNCQFATNPGRANADPGTRDYGVSSEVRIGSATYRNCYFEDHSSAILINPSVSNIYEVLIEDCIFTGRSNFPGEVCSYAIFAGGSTNAIYDLTIRNSRFGQIAGDSSGYNVAHVRNSSLLRNLRVEGCVNYDSPASGLALTNQVSNFQVRDTGVKAPTRTETVRFTGSIQNVSTTHTLTLGGFASLVTKFVPYRNCWVSKVTVVLGGNVSAGAFNVRVRKASTTVTDDTFPTAFDVYTEGTSFQVGNIVPPSTTYIEAGASYPISVQVLTNGSFAVTGGGAKQIDVYVELAY